jgi:hypothetical protein
MKLEQNMPREIETIGIKVVKRLLLAVFNSDVLVCVLCSVSY